MTSKQRAYLKSLAVNERAILSIGKEGLTPEVCKSVEEAFNTRELIKISVQKSCLEELNPLADTLAGRTRSQTVSVIGRKIVLYKEGKDEKRVIRLPS